MTNILAKLRALERERIATRAPDAPELVTDLTGAVHRPLVLTPEMRARMAHRIHVAAPTGPGDRIDLEKRIAGFPADVLITLEGLAMMAENGNRLAATVLIEERRRLGIDERTTTYRKGR